MPFEKGTFIKSNVSDPRFKQSSRYGFRVRWPIASDYEIVDGLLIPKPSATWRDSYPITRPNISARLAQIREGDEKALLAFARQYGGLGFANILPISAPYFFSWGGRVPIWRVLAEPACITDMPEEHYDSSMKGMFRHLVKDIVTNRAELKAAKSECGLDDRKIWEAMAKHDGGDPLPWIWAHIRTLNICCTLTEYIQDEDHELALSFLKKFNPDSDNLEFLSCDLAPTCDVAFLHRSARMAWFMGRELRDWTVLDFARYVRRDLINKNVEGIQLAIEPIGRSEGSFLKYRSLIEVAYWHLHNRVIDGKMRRCAREDCGAFFVQTDKRQKYCPEPTVGPTKQSLCGVKDRARQAMKKYRRRLKKKLQNK